jgi:glycogen(starch) synthase
MDAERDGLRVLLTTDTVGGVWQFAIELATQLARGGDQVLLAAMGREPDAAQRQQAAATPGVEFRARPYKLVWMGDPWSDLDASGAWLRGLAQDFAADIVHLNDLTHAELAWPAPVLVGAHSCVCSWWQAVHGGPAPASWDRYRGRVAASLHAADTVVAPTRAMLDALVRQHGTIASSRVIHNGRSVGAEPSVPKEPFVLGAGRLWDEAKNLGALAAVAPHLSWPVHLAGDARHPDGSESDFGTAHVLGRLPDADLRRWMARAAIYALPARYEPFGLSALEAAQCGCALVLGDIPSLREVWGDAALFVPPDDHDALATALLRLAEDDALRATMGHRARMRARRYSAEAMACGYRDVYVDLIGRCSVRVESIAPQPLRVAAGARA